MIFVAGTSGSGKSETLMGGQMERAAAMETGQLILIWRMKQKKESKILMANTSM